MGTGFGTRGGSTPGGDFKKIFRPPSAAGKFFRRRRHRGVKNFFRWGVYLVDRGVILPKNPKKWPHRGVKIFFPRGAKPPGVPPPPCFFRAGCRANFRLKGGCTPPHTPPQWAEGFKNKIFCLQILISCAQIDPWHLT